MSNKEKFLKAMLATAVVSSLFCSSAEASAVVSTEAITAGEGVGNNKDIMAAQKEVVATTIQRIYRGHAQRADNKINEIYDEINNILGSYTSQENEQGKYIIDNTNEIAEIQARLNTFNEKYESIINTLTPRLNVLKNSTYQEKRGMATYVLVYPSIISDDITNTLEWLKTGNELSDEEEEDGSVDVSFDGSGSQTPVNKSFDITLSGGSESDPERPMDDSLSSIHSSNSDGYDGDENTKDSESLPLTEFNLSSHNNNSHNTGSDANSSISGWSEESSKDLDVSLSEGDVEQEHVYSKDDIDIEQPEQKKPYKKYAEYEDLDLLKKSIKFKPLTFEEQKKTKSEVQDLSEELEKEAQKKAEAKAKDAAVQKITNLFKIRQAKKELEEKRKNQNTQSPQLFHIVYQVQEHENQGTNKVPSNWEKLRKAVVEEGKLIKDLGDYVLFIQDLSKKQQEELKKLEDTKEQERLEEYIENKASLAEVLAVKNVDTTSIIHHATNPISDAIESAMSSSTSDIMPSEAVPNIDVPVNMPDSSTAAAAAAGDEDLQGKAKRIWSKAFAATAKQKGSNAFKTNSFGGIIGSDIDIIENKLILGAAFSHADAKTKILGSYNMNSEANLGTIYSRYFITDSLALSGDLSYGLLKIKGLEKGKKSNKGRLFKASVTLSNNIGLNCANLFITPKLGLSYDAIKVKHSKSELKSNNFSGNLGLAISSRLAVSDDVVVTPSIHVGMKHVFNQEKTKIKLSATSYNGRTDLSPTEKSPKDMYNIGSSIEVSKYKALTLGLGYDFNFRKNYKAHSGFVKLEVKF